MPDVMSVEDRARAAAVALRQRAERPVARRIVRPAQRRPIVRVGFALACVVLLVAGLVAIGHRRHSSTTSATTHLRYVIGGLPAGWTVTQATEADASSPVGDGSYVLYGTAGDPTAPVVSVQWLSSDTHIKDAVYSLLMTTRAMEEIHTGERTASCGRRPLVSGAVSDGPEPAWRCVIALNGGWVQLQAAGVDRDQVVAMLNGFELVGNEVTMPKELLPASAVELAPTITGFGTLDGIENLSSVVQYTSGTHILGLTVNRVTDGDIAAAGLGAAWERVAVGGLTVYRIVEGYAVTWEANGLAFDVFGDANGLDLAELATTVRPASDDEWAAMTAAPDPGVTTTLTSSEGSAPTLPSFTGVVRDVEVSEHYSRTSPDAVEFTAQPQALGTLSVGLVAGAVYLSAEYMGDKVVLDDPTLAAAHLGYMAGPEVQGTSMTAVYAVTSNPDAVRMRVTCTDGTRYLVEFVPVGDHADMSVAAVFLPPELPMVVDVVDAAGNVLAQKQIS